MRWENTRSLSKKLSEDGFKDLKNIEGEKFTPKLFTNHLQKVSELPPGVP